MLRSIANWAHSCEVLLRAGDSLPYGTPHVAPDPCDLTGIAFVADPELPSLDTVNGRVEFLEVIGLRDGELAVWNSHRERSPAPARWR